MAEKMTRRTFMKSAAAAAAAISLSGVLTGGGSWQGGQYGDMFQAFVGEAKLKQVSPAGTFFVSDTLLGKPFATEEKDLRLNFPDAEIKEAYRNGQPAVLKIVINGISETLFLVKKNGGYAATKTLPSLTTV